MKLTVFYDQQFWVGVVEETVDSAIQAARFIFGAEPKDAEILWFVNHRMMSLILAAKLVQLNKRPHVKAVNPKRLARQAAAEMGRKGGSSASQEAIKADMASRKKERQVMCKDSNEQFRKHKREIAALKAKAKHRGK